MRFLEKVRSAQSSKKIIQQIFSKKQEINKIKFKRS